MHRSYFSLEPIEVEELFFLLHHVEQSRHDTISNETIFCWKFDRRRFTLRHPKSIDWSPARSSLRGEASRPPFRSSPFGTCSSSPLRSEGVKMRTPPSAAGVHGANDIFPGFFRGEKFEKNSSLTSRRTVIFKNHVCGSANIFTSGYRI